MILRRLLEYDRPYYYPWLTVQVAEIEMAIERDADNEIDMYETNLTLPNYYDD